MSSILDAIIGERLEYVQEDRNVEDRHPMAVHRGDTIVGHLPRKISTMFSLFIKTWRSY